MTDRKAWAEELREKAKRRREFVEKDLKSPFKWVREGGKVMLELAERDEARAAYLDREAGEVERLRAINEEIKRLKAAEDAVWEEYSVAPSDDKATRDKWERAGHLRRLEEDKFAKLAVKMARQALGEVGP